MKHCILLAIVLVCLFGCSGIAKNTAESSPLDGHIVFAPLTSGKTYMINENKEIVQTWDSNYFPGLSVYWNPDNSLYRTILIPGGGDFGGQGGGVQKIAADGTILWEYTYTSDTHWAHHDIVPLPNGNILFLLHC